MNNEEKILNGFKMFSVKTFVDYCNKYIDESLIVNEKYEFSGRENIHYTIQDNIKKGLHELFGIYGIDYADIFNKDLIRLGSYDMTTFLNCEGIVVWEVFGRYNFDRQVRKNASFSNKTFTYKGNVKFTLVEDYKKLENMSLYDFLMFLVEEKRKAIIGKKLSEIEEHKKMIKDLKKEVKDLESIVVKMEVM